MRILTVRAEINFVGQFGDVDIEAILDIIQDLRIILVRHECDGETFGTETTSTRNTMQVGVRILGHVVVEHDVDTFNVHATTEEIGGDQDAL